MADSLWYPSVEDVIAIHEDVISEYPGTPAGVRNRSDIELALEYIEEGNFGSGPETIYGRSYHLPRLLTTNHPFVDANKRTALNTTVVFYFLNGYRFEYDDEIRTVLKLFGADETAVN
jgi:death-on-curing protein